MRVLEAKRKCVAVIRSDITCAMVTLQTLQWSTRARPSAGHSQGNRLPHVPAGHTEAQPSANYPKMCLGLDFTYSSSGYIRFVKKYVKKKTMKFFH